MVDRNVSLALGGFISLSLSLVGDITVSQTLLTQQGVPVVALTNGKSYCFSSALDTW